MRWLFFFLSLPLYAQENIRIGIGENQAIDVPGLSRIAVGNGKLLKARAVPPSQILLTGLKLGRTSVHVWGNQERHLVVQVVPGEIIDRAVSGVRGGVVRTTLEFLEIDGSVSRNVGIRWPEVIQFSVAGSLGSQMSGLNYASAFSSARGWIQHMVREGWAKVLATPELYVRMGEEAVFSSGGELPVATSSENYGRFQKHVEWKPFGLSVKVRPQSVDSLHIFSDIDIDISEVDQGRAMDGIPALAKRHLQTKMESIAGETVVLSGLVRQVTSKERNALPLLGSIPVLGDFIFSSTNEAKDESEIFMAVTFSLSTREEQEQKQAAFRKRWAAP